MFPDGGLRDRLRNSQRRRNCSQNQRNATSRALQINLAFLARFVIDPALIQFAQAPEPCQKRGKVGGVKQRLLAELDAFEVTSFDRCVQRRAAETKQVECLVDRVRYFRKTEGPRVDRIDSGVLVV